MHNTQISHTTHGATDGFPIVMIHGYTVDHRVLLPLEPVFGSRPEYRRLYLDLPGHGKSPRLAEPASAHSLTAAVIEWITETVGAQPFAVVGQSFGGQIARAVTAHFGEQVHGSALLVPVVRWGQDRTLPHRTTLAQDEAFLAQLPAAERGLFANVMAQLTQAEWDGFATYLLPGWQAHDRLAATELEANFLLPRPPETSAAQHQGEHLLINGRQDALVGWHDQLELMDHYPNMTAAVLNGAGHNPQIETPEAVNELFGRWLDRVSLRA